MDCSIDTNQENKEQRKTEILLTKWQPYVTGEGLI